MSKALVIVILSVVLLSCIGNKNTRSKSNASCCSFNPLNAELAFGCNGGLLLRIEVLELNDKPDEFSKRIFITDSVTSHHFVVTPLIDKEKFYDKKLVIKIWYTHSTIHDYEISITPSDWLSGKILNCKEMRR